MHSRHYRTIYSSNCTRYQALTPLQNYLLKWLHEVPGTRATIELFTQVTARGTKHSRHYRTIYSSNCTRYQALTPLQNYLLQWLHEVPGTHASTELFTQVTVRGTRHSRHYRTIYSSDCTRYHAGTHATLELSADGQNSLAIDLTGRDCEEQSDTTRMLLLAVRDLPPVSLWTDACFHLPVCWQKIHHRLN